MGACFGRCFAKVTDSLSYRLYHRHTSMSCQGDEQAEKKHGVPVTLELLDEGGWQRGSNKYARLNSRNDPSTSSGLDTPLQILDVRNLMKQQTCVSSTPGSSLDLEWEHEGLPLPVIDNDKISTDGSQTSINNSQPSSLTASPWSRVSTPNSLEWDPVEADMYYFFIMMLKMKIDHMLHKYQQVL
ncbi:uncharacterized protein LOC124951398 isoform X3 [Vespa velutina]|uniref:uncharacterized protein LOC124951398 isoform X3 n=1 Tax=Vespa velutina TaxID=202808 RepID=UPI001FB4B8DF|nr:uncharacterized protein LOC124951398 isoform X3 [Vespa velutina]